MRAESSTSPVYPLGLRMDGRLAVVVGAGPVAVRRVAGLRAAGADVLVVAPEISTSLADLAARGLIRTRQGSYEAADLDGAWLVLAADQPTVNAEVSADAERLRLWCVRADDAAASSATVAAVGRGRAVRRGRTARSARLTGRGRVLVLGGARSGKSTTAEKFLASHDEVEYVATGALPDEHDEEWAARVHEHQQRRPPRWRTTETLDLERVLKSGDPAPVLIDCLSLWLARVMDECDAWASGGGAKDVDARVHRLLRSWRATSRRAIAVSNEVGCGVVPATASGRLYRDQLGRLNAAIAADSDEVWFCTAGLPQRLR